LSVSVTHTAHNDDQETVLISTEYVSACVIAVEEEEDEEEDEDEEDEEDEVIAKFEKTAKGGVSVTHTAYGDDQETVLISTEYVSGCMLLLACLLVLW
jgi:hypothetical protein